MKIGYIKTLTGFAVISILGVSAYFGYQYTQQQKEIKLVCNKFEELVVASNFGQDEKVLGNGIRTQRGDWGEFDVFDINNDGEIDILFRGGVYMYTLFNMHYRYFGVFEKKAYLDYLWYIENKYHWAGKILTNYFYHYKDEIGETVLTSSSQAYMQKFLPDDFQTIKIPYKDLFSILDEKIDDPDSEYEDEMLSRFMSNPIAIKSKHYVATNDRVLHTYFLTEATGKISNKSKTNDLKFSLLCKFSYADLIE